MNLPGFTAESSLGPAMGQYGGATMSGSSGAGVLPMQRGSLEIKPLQFQIFRCCQPGFGCVSQRRWPWERCRCIRSLTGPIILCDGLTLADF